MLADDSDKEEGEGRGEGGRIDLNRESRLARAGIRANGRGGPPRAPSASVVFLSAGARPPFRDRALK